VAVAILAGSPACADQWMPPEVRTTYSADSHVRFTVTPRAIASPLAYFDDKVRNEGDRKAGQKRGGLPIASGVLERQDKDGRWSVVWASRLVNEVAPVSVLVADSGNYVVTFDNWHAMGWGDNVVVIYGPGGALIRKLALTDFLPEPYFKTLPRSVSSIHWRGDSVITEPDEKLVLKVVIPGEHDFDSDKRTYVDVPVDLASGAAQPAANPAWPAALAAAEARAAQLKKYEEERERSFREPLVAPPTADGVEWDRYLVEAFFRLDPQWKKDFPIAHVLPAPDSKDFAWFVAWLDERMSEPDGGALMIACPAAPEALIKVLREHTAKLKPGQLKAWRIYVAVPLAYRDRAAAALERTGTTFIHLDPALPIPQRKARLDGETPDF